MKHLKLFVALFAMLALGVTNAWGAEWEKVTSAPADWSGEYLLVYESGSTAYVWTGVDAASCYTEGTISGDKITGDFVSLTIATMNGGYSIKVNGGTNDSKYIYGTSGSNKINFGTNANANTLTYESSSTKIESNTSVMRYNPQAGNLRFRYFKSSSYSSQEAVQLYKKVEQSEGGDETEDLGEALKWSAATATVQVGADDNVFPTLTNDKNVAVAYTSSSTDVATIDANGVVTLVKEGTTTISAFYEGGEIEGVTYAAKNVSYTLTVKPAPLVIEPIDGGIIDILTHDCLAATSSSYTNFSGKQAKNDNHSDAVYAGRSSRNGNSTQYTVQLTTIDKGRIATTTSGGLAKRVYVKWSTQGTLNTNNRSLYIYGSNTAFTGDETTAPSTQIGTITFTTGATEAYVDLTGDYKYIFMTGSGAIYMDEIQVTWVADDTPEVPTLDAPTFSLAEDTYTEAQEVTLSAEEGTIYYTLDGTTPDAESIEYTTPIVLDECGEITIKAIAISGEITSSVASATYTIKLPLNNSQANPYTEADAIEVYDGGCYDNQDVYVIGVVKTASYSSSYGNYTITLENGFQFYRFQETAENKFTEDYIQPGDTLVACGKLDKYNSNYQLAAGCYLVERKPYSAPKVDISNTPETAYTVAEAIALIDNVTSDLTKQVYVKGEISEVESFNDYYGSITYWIKDEEENTFQCYSGLGLNSEEFESVDDLVVGSQVVVYGTLKKHNDTYEFNYNNYIVSLTLPSYTVTVSVNDAEFGSVQDLAADGKYEHGTIATLTAVANDGYVFVNWTENEVEVSADAEYTFEVLEDRNLVANFKTVEPEVPTALDNIDSTVAPVKAIVNGQLIIIRNGIQYNAQGQVVK